MLLAECRRRPRESLQVSLHPRASKPLGAILTLLCLLSEDHGVRSMHPSVPAGFTFLAGHRRPRREFLEVSLGLPASSRHVQHLPRFCLLSGDPRRSRRAYLRHVRRVSLRVVCVLRMSVRLRSTRGGRETECAGASTADCESDEGLLTRAP